MQGRAVVGLTVLAWAVGGCLMDVTPSPAGSRTSRPKPADNSFCYECHASYESEKLNVVHERVGIGCKTCHGECSKHRADKDALLPPDVMFARPKINPFCMTCHPEAKLEKQTAHEPFFIGTMSKRMVCTDCHGDHELAVRTRRWDKNARMLLDGDVPRMACQNSAAARAH